MHTLAIMHRFALRLFNCHQKQFPLTPRSVRQRVWVLTPVFISNEVKSLRIERRKTAIIWFKDKVCIQLFKFQCKGSLIHSPGVQTENKSSGHELICQWLVSLAKHKLKSLDSFFLSTCLTINWFWPNILPLITSVKAIDIKFNYSSEAAINKFVAWIWAQRTPND